jgi:hypothetical protein
MKVKIIYWDSQLEMKKEEYQNYLKRQNVAKRALTLAQDQLEGVAFIHDALEPDVFKQELSKALTKLAVARNELFLSTYVPRKWSSEIQRKAKQDMEIIPRGQPLCRVKFCKFGKAEYVEEEKP